MKKIMIALVAMLTMAAPGKAMSYEQARNEALFLTDKMAYELNLNDEQYEAAYEINLDYLMGVTSYDDVYGTYWERRNLDMSYILLDWQWNAFCAATYFYRPLYWDAGYWHFGIYARYPHRDYFYFGRPVFYATYRGGHAWHHIGGHGYYYGHRDHFRPAAGRSHFGMLDRWNRGDYRHHHNGNVGRGYYGGNRNSSTRTTVGNGRYGNGHFDGNRNGNRNGNYDGNRNGNYDGNRNGSFSGNRNNGGSFGGHRDNNSFRGGNNSSTQRLNGSSSSTTRFSNHSSGSFGGSRATSSGSFGGSSTRSSGSFGGGSTRSSGSFSGSHGSAGGGHSASGGRSFGGHR